MPTPPIRGGLRRLGARAAAAVLVLASALALGCSLLPGPNVEQYAAERPQLDLPAFFAGTTQAWGMFQDRGGVVKRRFVVHIDGQGSGDAFELDEHFVYNDGMLQQRRWHLQRGADGLWRGRADDVVGEALGQVRGNALHWTYTLRLPVGNSSYDIACDDWMFLLDEHTMINRTRMSKFGIEVGQVTLFFRKPA